MAVQVDQLGAVDGDPREAAVHQPLEDLGDRLLLGLVQAAVQDDDGDALGVPEVDFQDLPGAPADFLFLEDLLDELAAQHLAFDQDLAQALGGPVVFDGGPLDGERLVDGGRGRQVAAHQQLTDLVVRIPELLGHSYPQIPISIPRLPGKPRKRPNIARPARRQVQSLANSTSLVCPNRTVVRVRLFEDAANCRK